MLETIVVLDFACSVCQGPVEVTLKCSGQGIKAGPHAVAGVPIPCPHCTTTNELFFELSGLVLAVRPEQKKQALQPSLN